MSEHRILIVYGTTYGQTAKIASRMRAVLLGDGFDITLAAADGIDPAIDLEQYQGVMVGGSLIRGKHQRSITRFVTRHLSTINRVPSAFFSVSSSAASTEPRGQADARRAMNAFLTETGWQPDKLTTLAGTLAYTKYSPILRWIMKRISRANGGPTDTSRDHELTDWAGVEEFAHSFGRVVAPVALLEVADKPGEIAPAITTARS
jgi:menaquinone-dependent protoporphyrinogen oxidase